MLSSQGEVIVNTFLKKSHLLVKRANQVLLDFIETPKYKKKGWHRYKITNIIPMKSLELTHCIISNLISHGIAKKEEFDLSSWFPELEIELHIANATDKKISSGLVVHNDNMAGDNITYTILVYLENTATGGDLGIYTPTGFLGFFGAKYVGSIDISQIDPKKSKQSQVIMFGGDTYHKPAPIMSGNRILVSFIINMNNRTKIKP